jgi:hypothetical protein
MMQVDGIWNVERGQKEGGMVCTDVDNDEDNVDGPNIK